MLLGVEFRRIARQAVQADVFGNPQFLGSVGTGTIHNHDDEFIRMCLTDLYEDSFICSVFIFAWRQVCDAVEYILHWGLKHRTVEPIRAIGVDQMMKSSTPKATNT